MDRNRGRPARPLDGGVAHGGRRPRQPEDQLGPVDCPFRQADDVGQAETTMTDLMEWAADFSVPRSLDAKPAKVKFTAEKLPAPAELRADGILAHWSWRRPN